MIRNGMDPCVELPTIFTFGLFSQLFLTFLIYATYHIDGL